MFAYGQTSSGKTHTISGCAGDPGITPSAIKHVFDLLNSYAEGMEFMVRVSYTEIYNEELHDLLQPENTNLKVFEDAVHGCVTL